MKKSILLILLSGTSLVSPQNNTTQICNFTGPSANEGQCQAIFQVTAESIKAVRCRNSGTIRAIVTVIDEFGVTFNPNQQITVTVTGPNSFSSSTSVTIPPGILFNFGSTFPIEISVPTAGSYTVTTNIASSFCIFTCINVRVKQINCLPFLYCCK